MPRHPETTATEWIFQAKDLRYPHVFGLLFAHPKLACALLTMRSFWWQTLLMGAVICLVGGGLLTMNDVPEYGKDIYAGSSFVLKTLNSVELSGGRVRWGDDYNALLPATTTLGHCQLDIVENWKDFQPARNSALRTGLVLCHDGLGLWSMGKDGSVNVRSLVLPAKLIPRGEEPLSLNEHNHLRFCRFVFFVILGSFLMANGLMLLESLCTTAFILCIVWMFIGRIRQFRAIPHFLMLGFNLAYPPFLTALVWALAGIPGGFENIFCITFILYLAYGAIEGRNGILRSA